LQKYGQLPALTNRAMDYLRGLNQSVQLNKKVVPLCFALEFCHPFNASNEGWSLGFVSDSLVDVRPFSGVRIARAKVKVSGGLVGTASVELLLHQKRLIR